MATQGVRTLPAQERKGGQIRKGRVQGQTLPSAHHLCRPAQILHTVKKEPIKATGIRLFVLFQKTRAYQHVIMCCIISIKLRWFPLMPGKDFIKAIELLLLEGYSLWVVLYFILLNGKKGLPQTFLWLYWCLLSSGSSFGMPFTERSCDTISGYFKTKNQILVNKPVSVMF